MHSRFPSLYFIIDMNQPVASIKQCVHAVAMSGFSMVQLPTHQGTPESLIALGQELKGILNPFGIPLIVQDHVEIAEAIEADGLHIEQSPTEVHTLRQQLGTDKIIGLTVETWSQLEMAQFLPLSYIGLSRVFASESKLGMHPVWGSVHVERACNFSTIPLVGIGGVGEKTIARLKHLPLKSLAVTSAVTQADSPSCAASALMSHLQA